VYNKGNTNIIHPIVPSLVLMSMTMITSLSMISIVVLTKMNVSDTIFIDDITYNNMTDDNMIQQVMNSSTKEKSSMNHRKSTNNYTITINGTQYRKVNMIRIMYGIHS
jgi:hypothetical protein